MTAAWFVSSKANAACSCRPSPLPHTTSADYQAVAINGATIIFMGRHCPPQQHKLLHVGHSAVGLLLSDVLLSIWSC